MDDKNLAGLARACGRAGDLLLQYRARGVSTRSKGGMELVTEADTASEELLASLLDDVCPGIPFVGEEGYSGSLPEPPFWMADPLDGTHNYAFDFPFYCVSVALIDDAGPAFSCTHDPLRGETFTARRGGGCFRNGVPVRCSPATDISEALLATGFPYGRTPQSIGTDLGVLAHFLGVARGIRRSGSAALDLAYTACGRLGGFWEERLQPWDMAAGVLLVLEAGGVAGAYEGGSWNLFSKGICAAAPGLWKPLRAGIEEGRRRDAPAQR